MYNDKSLKTILAILTLLVIGMFVVYYFVYDDIKSKNERVSSLQNDLSQEKNKQDYLISTQKVLQSIDPDVTRIKNSVIPKDGDVKFIGDLESLARGDGLTIDISSLLIDDNPENTSNSIDVLKIDAKIKGPWLATYTFLSQLESLPYKVKVNTFDFVNATDVSGPDRVISFNSDWQSVFQINVLKYK